MEIGDTINVSWSGFVGPCNVLVYQGDTRWKEADTNAPGSGNQDITAYSDWELRADYCIRVEEKSNTSLYRWSEDFEVKYQQPDIVAEKAYMFSIEDFGQELTDPKVGDIVHFKCEFRVDDSDINSSFALKCYLDNNSTPFYSTTYSSANAGSTYYPSTSGTWTVTAGAHNIRWEIDANNDISETSESNNTATKSWNVPDQFDLEGLGASIVDYNGDPATGYVGETVYFKFRYRIVGQGTTVPFDLRCNLDGSTYWTDDGIARTGEQTYSVTAPSGYVATEGSHNIEWTLDYNNEIDESNEANNVNDMGWTPAPVPNIDVTFPDGGETLIRGTEYTITWTSTNVSGNVKIEVYKNGSLHTQLAANDPNDGNYPFVPTEAFLDGSDYQIAITAVDESASDSSQAFFTIQEPVSDYPVFVPFYRLYKYDSGNSTRDHFYTTNKSERDTAKSTMGYTDEGIECYISDRNFQGGIPIYRLYKSDVNSHYFTTSETGKNQKITEGYVLEGDTGIIGYVYENPAQGLVPIHRLKQTSDTPDHYFLCTSSIEYQAVIGSGYIDETSPDGMGYVQAGMARETLAHGRPQANVGGVDLGSGAFTGAFTTGLAMKGRGPDLNFSFYYNSCMSNYHPYPMGPGWKHTLEASIDVDIDGNVFVKWLNGSISYFEKTGDGVSDYIDQSGNHDQITRMASGNQYDILRKDQTVYRYMKFNINPWPGSPFFDAISRLLLVDITDWKGNTLTFDRAADYGVVMEVRDNLGRKLNFEYFSPDLQLKQVSEEVGGVTKRIISFTYNEDFTLKSFTDARGKTTNYNYDVNGFLSGITYPELNTVTIGYDPDTRNAESVKVGNDPASSITYTPSSNTTTVADPQNNVFTYVHEGFRLTSQSGPDLNESLFEYTDTVNNPNKPTRIVDKENNSTDYEYDAIGNVEKITNADGKIATFTYNTKNNLLNSNQFRAVTASITPTIYSYDNDGNRLIGIENPEHDTTGINYDLNHQVSSVEDGRGYLTQFTYDAYGNLQTITDAENNVSTYTNDYAGRTTQVVDGENKNIWYGIDETDHLTSVKNHLNHMVNLEFNDNGLLDNINWINQGPTAATGYVYDDKNRLQSVTSPLSYVESYTYYNNGSLYTRNDANSIETTYHYDGNNRLESVEYPSHTTAFNRDKNGSIESVNCEHGNASRFTFNALNQVETVTDPFDKAVSYEYNDAGQLWKIIYPGNKTVTYTYDEAGRLKTVTDLLNRTTTYTYDAAGNLKTIVRPNGTSVTYTYDQASRLTGILDKKLDNTVICEYTYQLDRVGNHTQMDVTQPLTASPTATDVDFSYDRGNRILSDTATTFTHENTGTRKTSTTGGSTTTCSWDYENRLTGINSPTETITYQYDGLGNRIARIKDGATKKYVLDLTGGMSRVVAETDASGTITAYYVYGLGLISRISATEEQRFYHFNHRGDTVAMTDMAETVTDKYAYDSFGRLLASDPIIPAQPFTYVGQYGVMDEGNDIYFMRARFYDAARGRFISKDPIGFEGGDWNLYGYALNSPLNNIDPNGQSFFESLINLTSKSKSIIDHTREYYRIKHQLEEINFVSRNLSKYKEWKSLSQKTDFLDIISTAWFVGKAWYWSVETVACGYYGYKNDVYIQPMNSMEVLRVAPVVGEFIDFYEMEKEAYNSLKFLINK